ncbi:MAG: CBS domain-containing protein [Christensenellales bacterium]|jgi:CBS domain-containing protein
MKLNAEKKVSDIMTFDVITIEAQGTVKEAAILMRDNDIGFLPVTNGGSLVGVVTDRDLVIRGYAEGVKEEAKISEVMTPKCISVEHSSSVDKAVKLMSENKIRRLCVTENDKLIGVCAIGDVATSRGTKEEAGDALSQISRTENKNIFV